MNDRMIKRVRNIGTQHVSYSAVTKTKALRLELIDPQLKEFLKMVKVEDMRIAGHQNVGTTRKFQDELTEIISGKSGQWHLWEARICRHRLVLNYADRYAKNKRGKATALKCYLEWPDQLEMVVFTPDEQRPYYHITHLLTGERYDMLQVRYRNTEKATNGELDDVVTYETVKKRG